MTEKKIEENEEKKSLSFVEQMVEADLAERWKNTDTIPAGAQRIYTHRTRQGHMHGLWGGREIRRCVQSEIRRHKPLKGGHRVC